MEFKVIKNILFNSRDRLLIQLQRYKTIEDHTPSDSPFENNTDLNLSDPTTEKPTKAVFSDKQLKKIYMHLKHKSALTTDR